MIKSQASANSSPPPSANPLTAAMTGIGNSSKVLITRCPRRVNSRPSTVCMSAIAAISAPATKARSPAPGDDQHAHGRVVAHVTQHASDLLEHRSIERVERLGPVNRNRRNRAAFKNQVFHHLSSLAQGLGQRPQQRGAIAAPGAAMHTGHRRRLARQPDVRSCYAYFWRAKNSPCAREKLRLDQGCRFRSRRRMLSRLRKEIAAKAACRCAFPSGNRTPTHAADAARRTIAPHACRG